MRSATLHSAAPCRLVLGSFLLLQTLGLYSSLPLEGMIRISFYHTVVSFKFLFVWLVLLASISAALPSIPQASSCCGETTGKHGVLCTRLGLLLHYRVCEREEHRFPRSASALRAQEECTANLPFLFYMHQDISVGLGLHNNQTLRQDKETFLGNLPYLFAFKSGDRTHILTHARQSIYH